LQTWKRLLNRIVYNNDPDLILSPAKKNMDRYVIQAMLGTAFGVFSAGVFLTGYLLHLGAPVLLTTYVPILPNICGVFLIFLSTIVERRETRKKLLLTVNATCKVFLISAIFVPLLVDDPFRVPLVFGLTVIGQAVGCLNTIIFNSLFNELIPVQVKGRYFAVRQIFCVMVSAILPIAAGYLVDHMNDKYMAFFILFMGAALVGGIELLVFGRLDDAHIPPPKEKVSALKVFTLPLKNRAFIMYTLISCLFHFFLFISSSFSQVYLLSHLEMNFTFINFQAFIMFGLQMLFFYKFWGIVTDRIGSRFTLVICMAMYALDMLAWVFIDKSTIWVVYTILQLIAAVEGAGFTVAIYTRRYEIIPKEGRSLYDSFYLICLGITLFISPAAGSFLRNLFGKIEFLNGIEFGAYRAVYFLSTITILILQLAHMKYVTKNEEDKKLFGRETFKQVWRIFKEMLGLRR